MDIKLPFLALLTQQTLFIGLSIFSLGVVNKLKNKEWSLLVPPIISKINVVTSVFILLIYVFLINQPENEQDELFVGLLQFVLLAYAVNLFRSLRFLKAIKVSLMDKTNVAIVELSGLMSFFLVGYVLFVF